MRNILDNIGTEEDSIVTLIQNTNNKERQLIKTAYKQKHNEDLIARFQKTLNAELRELVIGSFMVPIEYDCYCLNSSLSSLKSEKREDNSSSKKEKKEDMKEIAITEIIGSRNDSELKLIKRLYKKKFFKTLESDITGDISRLYQKIILALLRCQRTTSSQPNASSCANDASDLYKLGEKGGKNDGETFIRIFTKSSPEEIAIINHFYKQQAGKGLLSAIDSEFNFSPEIKSLFDTIVRAQVDVYGFYGKKIHESLENVVMNKLILIRNICARYTIDIAKIKRAYERDYDNDMLEDIRSKTTGNFGKILYSLASKEK